MSKTVILGAGITGLTTAYRMKKAGRDFILIEKSDRVGGQIKSVVKDGFVYETGPTTSSISEPEIMEMFKDLEGLCELEIANSAANRRLIWKNGRFHELSFNPIKAISTPLFSFKDKLKILTEPLRPKGNNPNESIADLVRRRLGNSFLNYAVDPFISGIYAGNPETLITKYAMPKLYNLEQQYGGFIRGGIKKSFRKKTEREKLATKEVFSVKGGFSNLIKALETYIGEENIIKNADYKLTQKQKEWEISFNNEMPSIICSKVITTMGAHSLGEVLTFATKDEIASLQSLEYAPIVLANVGVNVDKDIVPKAFGGLIPSLENRGILGILFPAECFTDRAKEGSNLFAVFIGGIKNKDIINKTDKDISAIIYKELKDMLGIEDGISFIDIKRHKFAIPQYDAGAKGVIDTVKSMEDKYSGLHIGGNIIGGIGIPHRVKQAFHLASL